MRYLGRCYLVYEPLKTVTPAEVSAAEARLGLRFPDGYAEYMTELGEGVLSNDIRIWPPRQVEAELKEHRRRFAERCFWDRKGPLSPERLGETVCLGAMLTGDCLVFHPDRPDDLFWLPRHGDQIHQIGPGLEAAIDWLCDSGVPTKPARLRYFEPQGRRGRIKRSIPQPYAVVRDAVVGLELHDHIAWEEPAEDEEKVFSVFRRVFSIFRRGGSEFVEVDEEEAAILLLIQAIGGDVMVSTGLSFDSPVTDVCIEYVPDCDRTKLDRLVNLLDELGSRGDDPERPGW